MSRTNSSVNDHWPVSALGQPIFSLGLIILHSLFGVLILTFVGLICCEKGQKAAHILPAVGVCGEDTHKTI